MDDGRLPDGKQCVDCDKFANCKEQFRQAGFCTTCIWLPCAFKEKMQGVGRLPYWYPTTFAGGF